MTDVEIETAKKISNKAWSWFKKAATMQKDNDVWDKLIDTGNDFVIHQQDEGEWHLAKDLYLAYLNYVERKEGVYENVVRTMQGTINRGRNGR